MTPTVEASFLWIMVAFAFVCGAVCQQWAARAERAAVWAAIRTAMALIGELSALARAGGRPLPAGMQRRIVDLRDRWGVE